MTLTELLVELNYHRDNPLMWLCKEHIEALRTRIAEVEKDAARYRWLRECSNDALVMYGDTYNCELMMEEALDEAVDKAMKEQP